MISDDTRKELIADAQARMKMLKYKYRARKITLAELQVATKELDLMMARINQEANR